MGTAILRPIETQLVHGSFAVVFSHKAELTDRFYDYLFQATPEAKAMFKHDFSQQKEMFARMLASGVRCLEGDQELTPLVTRLLLHHHNLGLTPTHFFIAEQALMMALQEVMSPYLTSAEIAAWNAAFRRLCQSMAAGIETPVT